MRTTVQMSDKAAGELLADSKLYGSPVVLVVGGKHYQGVVEYFRTSRGLGLFTVKLDTLPRELVVAGDLRS